MTSPNGKRLDERDESTPETIGGLPVTKEAKSTGVRRRLDRKTGKEIEPGELPVATRSLSGKRRVADLKQSMEDEGLDSSILDGRRDDVEIEAEELTAESADELEAALAADLSVDVDVTGLGGERQEYERIVGQRIIALTDDTSFQAGQVLPFVKPAEKLAPLISDEADEDIPTKVEGSPTRYALIREKLREEEVAAQALIQVSDPADINVVADKVQNDVNSAMVLPTLEPELGRDELPTIVERPSARRHLHNANLDVEGLMDTYWPEIKQGGRPVLDRVLALYIAKKEMPDRQRAIDLISGTYGVSMGKIYGEYITQWWVSEDPVERILGQSNAGCQIIDEEVLASDLSEMGFELAMGDITPDMKQDVDPGSVRRYSFNQLKDVVRAKLINQGFRGRTYTERDLEGIIARKPPSGRPTNS